jgi:drug/metabolite transporter (DMT)-like permease
VSFSRLDALLLLMVIIWGGNFSVVKYALRDFPELPFNALRLVLASAVFIAAIAIQQGRRQKVGGARQPTDGGFFSLPFSAADWRGLCVMAVVGTLLYQLIFLAGLARTSVANSALLFGCTPVAVAILASLAGHERLTITRWLGASLSLVGVYAIVGRGAEISSATLLGDVLVFGGMLCWSAYSVMAQPLLKRHSPLVVTGVSMTIGTVLFLVVAAGPMSATDWSAISFTSWLLMAASSVFSLAFAYIIWYTAVQQIGSARTAVYSNLTPIVAMVVAALSLGEHISLRQIFGAVLILSGIAVTRMNTEPDIPRA